MFGIGLTLVWWVAMAASMVWWVNFHTEVPVHDESRRYQELRKRTGEDLFRVVRSFHYRRNAERWIHSRERFSGTLLLVDSRTGRILFERNIP